ncbi:hypothetical protein [Streptomyces niveus]|uniref:hypothetical protein n=1 Tax=Streptomyces niveus TaxID=193462 RepID=UPI0033B0355C
MDAYSVATMTYRVAAKPTAQGWDLKVGGVGRTTCSNLGEVESAARAYVVRMTGMPPERVLIEIARP